MFPAAFDYRAPASLQEALSILKERGDDAKVMAGGQSLIPLLKLRFARPELVVDIGRLPSMNNVMRRGGHTAIGALVRHVDVENSKELASSAPMMVEAARWISDPLVRNRGTLAGSVCHADPAGGWAMGREPTDRVIAEAGRLAGEAAEPKDDVRGSAAYKKDVVRVFVQRGLKTAIGRAREVKS